MRSRPVAAGAVTTLLVPGFVEASGARLFKSGPIQVSADGRWVWVVNPDNDSVSRIDTRDDSVNEFALAPGDSPR